MASTTIPIDLIENILSRLRVKSLLRFKSVSPEWDNLISSRSFIKLHQQSANSNSSSNRLGHILSCNTTKVKFYTLDLNSIINKDGGGGQLDGDDDEYLRVERLRVSLQSCFHVIPIGSCNGIVCLRNVGGWGFTLLNPSTQTHVKVPNLKADKLRALALNQVNNGLNSLSFGFGYDRVADDYKIVKVEQFSRNNNHKDDTEVYITKTMVYSWRNKRWDMFEDICYGIYGNMGTPVINRKEFYATINGVAYNNALHWLAIRKKELVILSFNLGIGKFERVVIPLPVDDIGEIGFQNKTLLVNIKGCLHLVVPKNKIEGGFHRGYEIDLWLMKDKSANKLWSRMASIFFPPDVWCPQVITYSESHKDILLRDGVANFYLADLFNGGDRNRSHYKMHNNFSTSGGCKMQHYIESLITLDHKRMKTFNKSPRVLRGENEIEEIRDELKRCRDRERCLQDRLRECIKRTRKDEEGGNANREDDSGEKQQITRGEVNASIAAELRAKFNELLTTYGLD